VANGRNAYKQIDIETASQEKLILLLLNGAMQRAEEGKRAIEKDDVQSAHAHLLRAQEIVSELRAALNMEAGEIADYLDRSYEYIHHLLVQANIQKDTALIDESVTHLAGFRDTWEELFRTTGQADSSAPAPRINPLGNSLINVEG
jgi:flagellar secretion chaperone FliS